MTPEDRDRTAGQALEFAESLWQRGDFWEVESSEFERARCARLIRLLEGRRYDRVLELGCGAGHFTRLLAPLAGQLVAFDIAPSAIERARAAGGGTGRIDYRVGNAMDCGWRADGPWDLVVMNETICYLGWLYPFFDIAWLVAEIHGAIRGGGRFLMANAMDEKYDKLLLPYIIRTYRDLCLNVGFRLERGETFRGAKHAVEFEVLISLFARPA
ncbi:MAG TPA: class I SAM-dependent methyltransferase [Burkholderiales bacterium]|nr:class I SAM-dependent methyltransferase [Burkholderiales bacterium]